MPATQNIENVMLSLPNADLAVLQMLSKRMGWKVQMRRKPPCQYTEEEVVQRVLQATAEAESGIGCLTLDEFEAQY